LRAGDLTCPEQCESKHRADAPPGFPGEQSFAFR
jgi:hypothetical protein